MSNMVRASLFPSISLILLFLQTAKSFQCNQSQFNISLDNIQCFGLSQVFNITTANDCFAACCSNPDCQMWEWCPENVVCTGWPQSQACFTGKSDLSQCKTANGWTGSAQPNLPPPPPPYFPSNFLTPYNGVAALISLDLASTNFNDESWTLIIDDDNSSARVIAVPYGGYNSDEQNLPYINSASVQSSATYVRNFTLPSSFQRNGTLRLLELGGCNHGCEIFINDQLVGAHYGPLLPFTIDITNSTSRLTDNYVLTIVSHPFAYFNGYVPSSFIYTEAWLPPSNGWGSRLPEGISKYIRVSAYPSVRVTDVSISTTVVSTTEPTFTANVTVINDSSEKICAEIAVLFSPWNTGMNWDYPVIPVSNPLLLPVSSTNQGKGIGNNRTTVQVKFQVPWNLDPSSYWWPNRPFNRSYITQLHWFNISILLSSGCGGDGEFSERRRERIDAGGIRGNVTSRTSDGRKDGSMEYSRNNEFSADKDNEIRSLFHSTNTELGLSTSPTILATAFQRFGYVEHKESTSYYYLLNGVRMNHLSDATPESGMSYYDAYVSPAFSLPSASSIGGPYSGGIYSTWSNYMQVGITSNRIHQSTPTQAMLDTSDEVGFLLKPESTTRGCPGYEPCLFNDIYLQNVAELVRFCKHSPSVFAYSVENESGGETTGPFANVIPSLIDAAVLEDNTRYLTTEGSGGNQAYYGTNVSGNARAINNLHYAVPPQDLSIIQGVGECAWCVENGMEEYASLALQGRLNDVAYYAGWDWINYWSNFLEGMNASRHAWKQEGCSGRDRTDGIDGWGSPVLDWVTRAFHPFTIVDVEMYKTNPIFKGPGWPYTVDQYTYNGGSGNITRDIVVFNDVLNGNDRPWMNNSDVWYIQLNWTAVWDSPDGNLTVGSGSYTVGENAGVGYVRPGFHGTVNLVFPIPDPQQSNRRLYIVMETVRPTKPDTVLYQENRTYVNVGGT